MVLLFLLRALAVTLSNMKAAFVLLVLATLSSSALAAPKISEIRLKDVPGYTGTPFSINEFVFRPDGTLYWLEGTNEKPIRHRFLVGENTFKSLSRALEQHRFFTLNPPRNEVPPYAYDAPCTILRVTRGRQAKQLILYHSSNNLWQLEMIVRGVASREIGLKRTSTSTTVP